MHDAPRRDYCPQPRDCHDAERRTAKGIPKRTRVDETDHFYVTKVPKEPYRMPSHRSWFLDVYRDASGYRASGLRAGCSAHL